MLGQNPRRYILINEVTIEKHELNFMIDLLHDQRRKVEALVKSDKPSASAELELIRMKSLISRMSRIVSAMDYSDGAAYGALHEPDQP